MAQAPSLFVMIFLLGLASGKKIVDYLPGFDGRLPFDIETGFDTSILLLRSSSFFFRGLTWSPSFKISYVLVDETQNANLFYSFVKSERNPADDPVMIWLIGGPGCSGFGKLINGFGKLKIFLSNSIRWSR